MADKPLPSTPTLAAIYAQLNDLKIPRVTSIVEDDEGVVHLLSASGHVVMMMPKDVYEDILAWDPNVVDVPR